MDSAFIYHRVSVIMARFNCDRETARKIKCGDIDPAELAKRPTTKKDKTKSDSEVTDV